MPDQDGELSILLGDVRALSPDGRRDPSGPAPGFPGHRRALCPALRGRVGGPGRQELGSCRGPGGRGDPRHRRGGCLAFKEVCQLPSNATTYWTSVMGPCPHPGQDPGHRRHRRRTSGAGPDPGYGGSRFHRGHLYRPSSCNRWGPQLSCGRGSGPHRARSGCHRVVPAHRFLQVQGHRHRPRPPRRLDAWIKL